MDENEGFVELVAGVECYKASDLDGARAHWSTAEEIGALPALFARTLRLNLDGAQPPRNPYTADADAEHRQIDLFEQVRRLEFVHIGEQLVVSACTDAPAGTTLLELGIGHGESTAAIVAASRGNITRVIGVDIDPTSVEASGELLRSLDVDFVGVTQDFAKLDWGHIRQSCTGSVYVNAAFALHHLDLKGKEHVLKKVASLEPQRVTLIEPSSSHASADILERLIGCYAHYSALWAAIKASTVRRDAQRAVLRFLGREISDIMRDDPGRYQRDEHWVFWYRLLLRAGLRPVPFPSAHLDPEVVQLLPGAANVHARNTHLITIFSFAVR